MTDRVTRARIIGALVLVGAFGAGIIVGMYLPRAPKVGVVITVNASDRIPSELEDLGLTDSQRVLIRGMLRAGSQRVDGIVRGFTVPMEAAVDSTDREIRAVLTDSQNRLLDAARVDRPLLRMRKQRIIKDVRDTGR